MDKVKDLVFKRHKMSKKLANTNLELAKELSELKCSLQQAIFEHIKNESEGIIELFGFNYYENDPRDETHINLANKTTYEIAKSLEIPPSAFKNGWNIYIDNHQLCKLIVLARMNHYTDQRLDLDSKYCPIYRINGRKD